MDLEQAPDSEFKNNNFSQKADIESGVKGNGETIDAEDITEALTRKKHERWSGLFFIAFAMLSSMSLMGFVIYLACKFTNEYYSYLKLFKGAPKTSQTDILAHLAPIVPILSLTIITLLVFVTTARFIKEFTNSGAARNSINEDGIIIDAINKIYTAFKAKK